jgi:hypothetical protein
LNLAHKGHAAHLRPVTWPAGRFCSGLGQPAQDAVQFSSVWCKFDDTACPRISRHSTIREWTSLRIAIDTGGTFQPEDRLDDDGVTDTPRKIAVCLQLDPEIASLHVDFTGSSAQVAGSITLAIVPLRSFGNSGFSRVQEYPPFFGGHRNHLVCQLSDCLSDVAAILRSSFCLSNLAQSWQRHCRFRYLPTDSEGG